MNMLGKFAMQDILYTCLAYTYVCMYVVNKVNL